jgi:putative mRNA 3-end processing factor
MAVPLLETDRSGLSCPLGGFHVDPWRPVPVAVVSHAHGDHARPGSGRYLCAAPGVGVLRRRVGMDAVIEGVPYGEIVELGGARVSFHPAGHVLGSAQVRVEGGREVWVFSGDYKRQADPTCAGFEVVPCDTFITEATFALPIYRWRPTEGVIAEILEWWRANEAAGRASVLFCYSLGKAQRVLAELSRHVDRTVYVHGTVAPMDEAYREAGVRMLPVERVLEADAGGRRGAKRFAGELVIAPPSAAGSPWMRRFGAGPQFETGFASGWMRVRGIRRRRGYDRGFVLSDHADWHDLLRTVRETGARRVLATHGYSEVLARHLREHEDVEAEVLATPYKPEDED